MGKILQDLSFHLDGTGNGVVSYSKWTAGITINAKAKILSPSGSYHIELYVNGKRKLSKDITDNEEVSQKIGTPFFKTTNIKVTVHSDDVSDQDGIIHLEATC